MVSYRHRGKKEPAVAMRLWGIPRFQEFLPHKLPSNPSNSFSWTSGTCRGGTTAQILTISSSSVNSNCKTDKDALVAFLRPLRHCHHWSTLDLWGCGFLSPDYKKLIINQTEVDHPGQHEDCGAVCLYLLSKYGSHTSSPGRYNLQSLHYSSLSTQYMEVRIFQSSLFLSCFLSLPQLVKLQHNNYEDDLSSLHSN